MTHGEDDARRLTNALFTLVLPLMTCWRSSASCSPGPSQACSRTGARRGSSQAEAERTVDLAVLFFRIFALQMLFYGISTIATGVLQAHRRFFLPFAPVLNNSSS